MKLFRCQVCGDPILQLEKPSCCPFCGAHRERIVAATEYKEPEAFELSAASRANLEKALDVEVGNSRFYRCASDMADSTLVKQLFKALSKIEAEHAATILKVLVVDKPTIEPVASDCFPGTEENLTDARRREAHASAFYRQASEDAVEPRISEIFTALVEVEGDHLSILEAFETHKVEASTSLYS